MLSSARFSGTAYQLGPANKLSIAGLVVIECRVGVEVSRRSLAFSRGFVKDRRAFNHRPAFYTRHIHVIIMVFLVNRRRLPILDMDMNLPSGCKLDPIVSCFTNRIVIGKLGRSLASYLYSIASLKVRFLPCGYVF